jgi:hypothetical protein
MGFVSRLLALVRLRSSLGGLVLALALALPSAKVAAAPLHPGQHLITTVNGIFSVDPITGARRS